MNLYYNALPPGVETRCLVGRLEALRETPLPLRSPTLEADGQKMVFPVSLQPDEYLEMDWHGRCRRFEPNGGLLGEVKPQGQLVLPPGASQVRFACARGDATSPRAEVTLALRGAPLANARRCGSPRAGRGARGPGAWLRFPSLAAQPGEAGDTWAFLPGAKGSYRLMQGSFERYDPEPAYTLPSFDGTAHTWTVRSDGDRPRRAAVVIARDDLKAPGHPSDRLPLRHPVFTLNGRRLALPGELRTPGEALLVDGAGCCSVWRAGQSRGRPTTLPGGSLLLQPGENRLEFTCQVPKGRRYDVSVRVVRLDAGDE